MSISVTSVLILPSFLPACLKSGLLLSHLFLKVPIHFSYLPRVEHIFPAPIRNLLHKIFLEQLILFGVRKIGSRVKNE